MDSARERHCRRPIGARHSRLIYSSCGMYKASKFQRPPLKWKKDQFNRGKRKGAFNKKKDEAVKKTPEEAEEEERRRKLKDTANELRNKLKTWSAGQVNSDSGESEGNPQNASITNSIRMEYSRSGKKEEIPQKVDRSKPKRVAHSNSVSAKKIVKKALPQTRTPNQYDVNKETLKDFQNRIQHKLIEDIMQMPKENLQNMLNDPKINPVMEAKMTRLVRENKPLIAKKLRAMAEEKIKSSGSSQVLLDFDKLIDPVIETDLSVLPYELIKQMEKAFQVQFDYSPDGQKPIENEMASEILDNVQEDVCAYDCSTDEDEDNSDVIIMEHGEFLPQLKAEVMEPPSSPPAIQIKQRFSEVEDVRDIKPDLFAIQSQAGLCKKETTACQTHRYTENVSTQTDPGFLYGVPLPVEAKDKSHASLMEEVNSIQNLINKLNEKRFGLFLQLARMNENENFNYLANKNFIETVSNGSISLIESLSNVLRVRNCEQSHSRPKARCNSQRNYARQDGRK